MAGINDRWRSLQPAVSCKDAWSTLFPADVNRLDGHSCRQKVLQGECATFKGVCARSCGACSVSEEEHPGPRESSSITDWWKELVAPSPPSPLQQPPPPRPPSMPHDPRPSPPPLPSEVQPPTQRSFHPHPQQARLPSPDPSSSPRLPSRIVPLSAAPPPQKGIRQPCAVRTTYKVVDLEDFGRRSKVAIAVQPWITGSIIVLSFPSALRLQPYGVTGALLSTRGPALVELQLLTPAANSELNFWLDSEEAAPEITCELNPPPSPIEASLSQRSGQSSVEHSSHCPLDAQLSIVDIQDSIVTVKVALGVWLPDSLISLQFGKEEQISMPTSWHGATLVKSAPHMLSFYIKDRKIHEHNAKYFTFSVPGSDDFTLPRSITCVLPASPPPSPISPNPPLEPPPPPPPSPCSPSPPTSPPGVPYPSPYPPPQTPPAYPPPPNHRPPPSTPPLPLLSPSQPSMPTLAHVQAPVVSPPVPPAPLPWKLPAPSSSTSAGAAQQDAFTVIGCVVLFLMVVLIVGYCVWRTKAKKRKSDYDVDDESHVGLMMPERAPTRHEESFLNLAGQRPRLHPVAGADELDVLIDDILGARQSPKIRHSELQNQEAPIKANASRSTPSLGHLTSQAGRNLTLHASCDVREHYHMSMPKQACTFQEADQFQTHGSCGGAPPSHGGQGIPNDAVVSDVPSIHNNASPADMAAQRKQNLPLSSSDLSKPRPDVSNLVKRFEVTCPAINGAYRRTPQPLQASAPVHSPAPATSGSDSKSLIDDVLRDLESDTT